MRPFLRSRSIADRLSRGAAMALLLCSVGVHAGEKQWREVKDPHFGEVLFYFYQQKYFSAITRLLSSQAQHRVSRHEGEAELLRGGLYLSYGLHAEAGRIFERLIDGNTTPAVRDRAWFYLAKIRYQRGYLADARAALARVQGTLPGDLQPEGQLLTALVLMEQQRYQQAVDTLKKFRGSADWASYARYNMGVAMIEAGEKVAGVKLLEQVGRMRAHDNEMDALKDKANLALGYAFLRVQGPERARSYLQEVRLQGPFSNRALLGIGWAHAARGDFRGALTPWMELQRRNPIDVAVQESLLAVPYALRKLHAGPQSLQHYESAIAVYEGEIERLGEAIANIRAGKLLIADLLEDATNETGWFWQIRNLADTPENRYLLQLLASHGFQETLKGYRDLLQLAANLRRWSASMGAYDAMLETRRATYEERLPRISQSYQALDLTVLRQARDGLAQELQRIEHSGDAMALATSREQALLARLQRVSEALTALAAPSTDVTDYQRRYRLYYGLLRWAVSTDYAPRLWQAKKSLRQLDQAIAQARTRGQSLRQAQLFARASFEGYSERIVALRRRIAILQRDVGEGLQAQARYLQTLAAHELEQLQSRLRGYVTQAQFGIAQIYDQSVNRAGVTQ